MKHLHFFFLITLSFLLILNHNVYADNSNPAPQIFIIEDNDINIHKLYKNIISNKKLLTKNKKYFITAKKGKIGNKNLKIIILSVYFDYEKELLKITNDPHINEINIDAWGWAYSNKIHDWKDIFSQTSIKLKSEAISKCNKKAKKLKLLGGECIIVEARNPLPLTGDLPRIHNLLNHERDNRVLNVNYKSKKTIIKLTNKKNEDEINKELLKQKLKDKKKRAEELKQIRKKKTAEKLKQIKKKKRVEDLKQNKKKLSLLNENELEISQRIIDYTKKFIQLNPNEFEIIEIAKLIINVKSISQGVINKENLKNLNKLREFTSISNKFAKYEKNLIANEQIRKIEIVDNEINNLKKNIKISKDYLAKNIDGFYAEDFIVLISNAELAVSNPLSFAQIKKNINDLKKLNSKTEILDNNIKILKELIILLKNKLKKSLSTDKAPILIKQIEKLEYVRNNIDIETINKLILETNNFLNEEITNNKNDSSKKVDIDDDVNTENKVYASSTKNKVDEIFINLDENTAVNKLHYNTVNKFNAQIDELKLYLNNTDSKKKRYKKNPLSVDGKKLLCTDDRVGENISTMIGYIFTEKDGDEGNFLGYNFEFYQIFDDLIKTGTGNTVILDGLQFYPVNYSSNSKTINITFASSINRENGNFTKHEYDIYSGTMLSKEVGKCINFEGDLHEFFKLFKKASVVASSKREKKIDNNKF